MNRYKYLFKNIGLLTISNFGTKILSFVLVPLYTSILTTEEYGTYDLFNTTISLLLPILTLNISDAVLRFAIDKDNSSEDIFKIGSKIILKGTVLLFVVLLINYYTGLIPMLNQYIFCFVLLYVTRNIYNLLSNYSRGVDKISALAVAGVLNSFATLSLNVFFLVYCRFGLVGYFYANIIGCIVPAIYLFFSTKAYKVFKHKTNNIKLKKEMLVYSKPLVVNSISWWVNSALDRYVVIAFCGVAVNGIYSVAYKIPSIMNMFQSIFNQAWTLSSVKSYDSEDKKGFFTNIYSIYNFFMVIVCSGLILLTKILAKLLYAKDFYLAWKYVPFLMISIVFGALSGLMEGVFSAAKDTKICAKSTAVGAICNLVLNLFLVKYYGALGAAIATAVSYFIIWCIRLKQVYKYVDLKIRIIRDIISYLILLIQTVIILFLNNNLKMYLLQSFCIFLLIIMYYKEIGQLMKKIFSRTRE